MKKQITKILIYFCYILFRPIWCIERIIPRSKNIWIFGSWYGQRYSDNSRWLYEYVLENYPDINVIWVTKNRDIYNKLVSQKKPVCMSASFTGIKYCLRAKFVFLTCNQLDVNRFFLNGANQIWLWHGMPLKKILYDDDSNKKSARWKKNIVNSLNPYSILKPCATLTSSEFFIPILQSAFLLPKGKIWTTGLPRCDAFFRERNEEYIEHLRNEFPDARIMFYMPTFRMSSSMDGKIFSAFISDYGFDEIEFIDFLEKNNIVFLFKPHFVDNNINIKINSPRFRYISDSDFDDLYKLLNCVDILVTDYSSVYFDFLATKKPIFLLTFDYEEYIRHSRGHYFDMYKEMHAKSCKNWNELYVAIERNHVNDLGDDYKKFAQFVDGFSCKKIINKIKEL